MNRSALLLATLVPLSALVASPAEAAETGAVRGQVLDDQGLPVPNATVVITGVNVAGERTVVTDGNGEFRTLGLPPGPKDVLIRKEGFAPTRYTVTIRLDETAFVPVTLKSAGGGMEEIIVEETLPVVDATRSAVSQQMTTDLLQNVPVGRSYQSAVNMVPGVYGRVDTQNGGPGGGNPSVRGEGQYGNNYLVDGISTRDPATKTFGSNVNFDAIQEIQVFTDGYPAEFSNATGMLVNVVTKDGANEHFGSAGYFLDMSACNDLFAEDDGLGAIKLKALLGEDYTADLAAYEEKYAESGCYYSVQDSVFGKEIPTRKRSTFDHELSLTAGGPIVKDKLWYFGAATFKYLNERYEGQSQSSPYLGSTWQAMGKVTWFPASTLSVQAQVSASGTGIDNYETSPLFSTESQARREQSNFSPLLTTRFRPSEKTELELKLTYWQMSLDQVPMCVNADGSAKSAEECLGDAAVQDENSYYTGNYDSFDYNDRSRLGGSLKWTQLVEGVFGDHKFKSGIEMWQVYSSREVVYTGQGWDDYFDSQPWSDPASVEDQSGYLFYKDEAGGYPCTEAANYTDCAGYRQSDVVDPIPGTSNLFGLFVQDDWSVDPVTFNIGFRLDHETDFQSDGTKIIDFWMPAPRFGAAWDITQDSKTVLTVNAGRYYDINGTDFVQWANTRSSNKYSEYRTNGDGTYSLDFQQDPAGHPLIYCTQESLDQLVTLEELDEATADNIWKTFCGEETLKPYHMDKVVVGFKREIVPLLAVGVKGIMSHSEDFPEDVDYDLDYWVVTNPVNADGSSAKVRDYRALELTVERKFDGVWQMLGSYTLSESEGHMPGQFEIASGGASGSDGNEVGVYMDDVNDQATRDFFFENGYGWLLDGLAGLGRQGDRSYYGYLPYHSFHQVKLAGSYMLPSNTTIGAVYEYDSGHAWQKRGEVYLYGDYFAFPEGRGTRFMPAVHYVNLRVAQAIAFNDRQDLEISLDVFNVLDLATPVTYYENEGEAFGEVMYRQSPLAFRLGANFTY